MDDDIADLFWADYAADAADHFAVMEESLMRMESGEATAADVDSMFRAIHTIKGNSRFLALGNIEAVAHAGEDLLDLVRDSGSQIDRSLADELFHLCDWMKRAVEESCATRKDASENRELMASLIERRTQYPQGPPAYDDVLQDASVEQNPELSRLRDFHPEPELLVIYTSMVKTELAVWLKLLSARDGLAPDALDPFERSAAMLAHGATTLEFLVLAQAWRALEVLLSSPLATTPELLPAALPIFTEIAELLVHLESVTSLDCGATNFGNELGKIRHEPRVNLQLPLILLRRWQDLGDRHPDNIADWLAQASPLIDAAMKNSLTRTAQVMVQIINIGKKLEVGSVDFSPELAAILLDCMELVCAALEHGHDLAETDSEHSAARLHNFAIRDIQATAVDMRERRLAMNERVDIRPELVEIMSGDHMTQVLSALDEHKIVAEILADLADVADETEQFLRGINDFAKIVTNRTVYRGDSTWLEFVVVIPSPQKLSGLQELLSSIDPAASRFQLHQCDLRDAQILAQPAMSSDPERAPVGSASTVLRVESAVVDKFLKQIGELVIARSSLAHAMSGPTAGSTLNTIGMALSRLGPGADREAVSMLRGAHNELSSHFRRVAEIEERIHAAVNRLQEGVMELRVIPVGTIFRRFPRMVRNLSRELGKEVRVSMSGEDVRIDKGMVEALIDPMMHLVRNSLDHGFESPEERKNTGKPVQGSLDLSAHQRGNQVIIRIEDDGQGIDTEKVKAHAVQRGIVSAQEAAALSQEEASHLIFKPGVSTAESVSDISGRGVGLDVVLSTVQKLGGDVLIQSEAGHSCRFELILPLSVAIQTALLFSVAEHVFAVPDRFITEILDVPTSAIQPVHGQEGVPWRDGHLPVVFFSDVFGFQGRSPSDSIDATHSVLALEFSGQSLGLIVDVVLERDELYVEDLHPEVMAVPGIGAAAILGDGRVVIVIDVEELFMLSTRYRRAAVELGDSDVAGIS